MNERDLLRAFQEVDTGFLDEAEHRILTAEAAKHELPEIKRQREEENLSQNKLFHILTGAAAVVAICSIAVAAWSAMRPDGALVASQPSETTAATEESAGTDPPAQTAESGTAVTETAGTTAVTLPEEDFVEATQTTTAETLPQTIVGYAMSIGLGDDNGETVEMPAVGEKMYLDLATDLSIENADTVKMQVMLVQDGELLPVALSENGETALVQEYDAEVHKVYLDRQDDGVSYVSREWDTDPTVIRLWFTPTHYSEYSILHAVVVYYTDDMFDTDNELSFGCLVSYSNVQTAFVPVHTDTVVPRTDVQYAVASAEDFVDVPAGITLRENGCCVNKMMDYSANVPNKYSVFGEMQQHQVTLNRDEMYARLHYSVSDNAYRYYVQNENKIYAKCVLDRMCVLLICDGKPMNWFDGKATLYLDKPASDKTLSYHLSVDDSLKSGEHLITAIALADWHDAFDSESMFLWNADNPQGSYSYIIE